MRSRSKQKLVEQAALTAFARALEAQGIPPIYALEITDRPDAVFLINDSITAVECRYVSHPELVRLQAPNDWPTNHVYEVILPLEPHLWVKLAIEEKNPNVSIYKSRCGANCAWLLLHSSAYHRILHDNKAKGSEYFELLRLGCHLVAHDFDQIWIAELNDPDSMATCIYKVGDERPDVDVEDFIARNPPYPLNNFWISKAEIRSKDDEGMAKIELNINDLVTKPVCIQPLDTRHIINYERILSIPGRNNNLTNLSWTWRDIQAKF
jgi:hypothetical protein